MKTTSIKFRLNVLFVLIISILLLAFGAVNYVKTKATLETSADRQVEATLSRLGASLPNSLWNFDKAQIEQNLASEMSATFIVGITITNGEKMLGGSVRDADGKIMQVTKMPVADFTKSVDLVYVDGGKPNAVGKATVFVSYDEIKKSLR